MKRTKYINKDKFRKKWVFYRHPLIFSGILSAGLFLTGCDDANDVDFDNTEYTDTTIKQYLDRPFTSAIDCYSNSDLTYDQCKNLKEQSINEAANNSKAYKNKADCEKEYPNTDCDIAQQGTSSAHYYPYPHYFGYNSSSGMGRAFYPQNTGSSGFRSLSGETFKAKVASIPRTRTITRGGFGSSASSHSSRSSHSSFHSSGHSRGG